MKKGGVKRFLEGGSVLLTALTLIIFINFFIDLNLVLNAIDNVTFPWYLYIYSSYLSFIYLVLCSCSFCIGFFFGSLIHIRVLLSNNNCHGSLFWSFVRTLGCTNLTIIGSWDRVLSPTTTGVAKMSICHNISFFEGVNSNDSISDDRNTSAAKEKKKGQRDDINKDSYLLIFNSAHLNPLIYFDGQ